ncbi:MAG: hypothetical protein P9L94_08515 [Candidatus Hinthialibacter antarcticus]|nr:hypothetical protein [Candidatus Hinthialibacter antarcticus]
MLRKLLRMFKHFLSRNSDSSVDLTSLKLLQGKLISMQVEKFGVLSDIEKSEFKVFSQFGEDGIIQYLIRITKITNAESIFIEFGVQNYEESNTRFLLMNNNWKGLIIDGDENNIQHVKKSELYWRQDLTAVTAFIDLDNINMLISKAGLSGEIGLLSIDIDGNDYWVWEKIDVVNPVIVIVEYNSVFGKSHGITIPYDSIFERNKAHFSNLYWGCSLKALQHLAKRKGYELVGCNQAGNNAFFVRHDRLNGLQPKSVDDAYVESRFRESRNKAGELTYLSGKDRFSAIDTLPIVDIETNKTSILKDIIK